MTNPPDDGLVAATLTLIGVKATSPRPRDPPSGATMGTPPAERAVYLMCISANFDH